MMTIDERKKALRTWWRPLRMRRALRETLLEREELTAKLEHVGQLAHDWMTKAKSGKPLDLAKFAIDEPRHDGITPPLAAALRDHLLAIGQQLTAQARGMGDGPEASNEAGGWAMKNYLASLAAAETYLGELYEVFRTVTEPPPDTYRRAGQEIGREGWAGSETGELARGIKNGTIVAIPRGAS